MILFGRRKQLAREYEKWLEKNPMVKDCPENVIAFLVMHNLLDADATAQYLKEIERVELYTVVGYDKDNDVFVTYDSTIYKDKAIAMAKEYADMVENGELRWPGTDEGEPIDWISVYKGWATEDEEKIWTSYEESED